MKILVLGATGFLGKHVCKKLNERGLSYAASSLSSGADLRDKNETFKLFEKEKPEYVLNCASYVGGIHFGYKHFTEIFSNNLLMAVNILEASNEFKIKRLVNPISNCAYPSKANLFKENEFWDGPLHESVLVYGFVRKAFWVGSWAYNFQHGLDVVNIILSNMYGPDDHFEEERSHALGALIMKFAKAKINNEPAVTIWGTGKPIREWLHVHDGAEAMIRSLYIQPHIDPINIGVANGISISELALRIKENIGFNGQMIFDPSKPDGADYKTVDGSKGLKLLGWGPEVPLDKGLPETIEWYIKNKI